MRNLLTISVCALLSLSRTLFGQVTNDESAFGLRTDEIAREMSIDGPTEDSFADRFEYFFKKEQIRLFYNEFNPLRYGRWRLLYEDDPRGLIRQADRSATSTFEKSLEYAAREAFATTPAMYWLDDMGTAVSLFARGTIGAIEEEEVRPTDISYRPIEQSWWRSFSENNFRYGLRFNARPYAYVGFKLGPHDNPYAMVDLRYRTFQFFHGSRFLDIGAHRFELALSLRPIDGYSVGIGTSYELKRGDEVAGLAVRFQKELKRVGAIFVGADVKSHSEFFWGVTRSF